MASGGAQTRSSTNAADLVSSKVDYKDSNILGYCHIKASKLMKTTYFSDWVKLYDDNKNVVAKVLLKNQFVVKNENPKPKKKKVRFTKEQICISDGCMSDNSNDSSFVHTFKGALREAIPSYKKGAKMIPELRGSFSDSN